MILVVSGAACEGMELKGGKVRGSLVDTKLAFEIPLQEISQDIHTLYIENCLITAYCTIPLSPWMQLEIIYT